MFRTSQTALQRYKVRRGAPAATLRPVTNWPRVGIMLLIPLVVYAVTRHLLPSGVPQPVTLTYELDLQKAPQHDLTVTMIIEGNLPGTLDLGLPPGAFGTQNPAVVISMPEANTLTADGIQGQTLTVERHEQGWQIDTEGSARIGVIYHLFLRGASGQEVDIRKHISSPVNGGVRAAGYELFLQPTGLPTTGLTIAVHNPNDLPFMAPWPALVHQQDFRPTAMAKKTSQANIAPGMGYNPVAGNTNPRPMHNNQSLSEPVPTNLLYHPQNLDDMNNSLLVCGNIRTTVVRARGTVIQLATDHAWQFSLDQARDMVARIARTEVAFFGSAPTDQITVMFAANEVTSREGFDAYGLHTGSSVLVMLNPDITVDQLRENAASVIAHEMFHGWLGEAIPQTDPSTLWFTEGATTWFAARMLTASGIWTPAHAREVLGDRLTRNYAQSPLLGKISVAEASAEVMAGPDEVRYAYASAVASCIALDHWLATKSGMMRPLDQILRILYSRHAGQALSRASLINVTQDVTGVDCGPWLDQHIYSTASLPPLENLL